MHSPRDSTEIRPPETRPHTTRTRDAALRRLARSNRWLLAGSTALAGMLTAVAANAFPGKAVKTTPAGAHVSATSQRSSSESAGTSTSSSGSLQQPAQAPQSSSAEESSPVVSGGS
jgi:hypothetical protein